MLQLIIYINYILTINKSVRNIIFILHIFLYYILHTTYNYI
jgi:hypothetical protein